MTYGRLAVGWRRPNREGFNPTSITCMDSIYKYVYIYICSQSAIDPSAIFCSLPNLRSGYLA